MDRATGNQGVADAVVIGSGPNGLAAAIRLAEHGWSVIVLEAQAHLGGALATEELTLPGFQHDVFSAVYPSGVASPVFARLPLHQHGLRWIFPPVAMAHPLPDGQAGALYADLERTAESLDRLDGQSGRRWQEFMRPLLDNGDALQQTLLSSFPPIGGVFQVLRHIGLRGSLDIARLLLLPATVFATEIFASDAARAWFYGTCLHADVPPWEAGSAITGIYLSFLGHRVGWPSPEGGAGRLAAALVGYLHSLGGTTRTQSPVAQILDNHTHTRVWGVRTATGQTIRASVVIGDLTPHGLLVLAGHLLPRQYRHNLARYRYGPQTLKVDWALNAPIPWIAGEARAAGTVHVGGRPETITQATAALLAGTLAECPFLVLGQQSLADPTRAPAGRHTAWAYTHVPGGIDWQREGERHVERMEEQVERFAPGFRATIMARHVALPDDLAVRNQNLVGGDVGGGSYALDQLIFRPVPTLSPYRTPLRGLYLGSAATFPGGGVHGVGGDAAARAALHDTQWLAPLTRRL